MTEPRNHHFIPAFYLSRWAAPKGELIEWSRPHKEVKPIRRHPDATAYQRDLYAFLELPPNERQWIETKFFQLTDDIASKALTKILAGQMDTLDDLQRIGWARFLMTLRFRHPDLVTEVRDGIAMLWKNHDRFTKVPYELARSAEDPESFDELLAQLSPDADIRTQLNLLIGSMDNKQIRGHIVSMAWTVLDVSAATHRLLTSDWPVELTLSLRAKSSTVSLPLSPTLLFVACDNVNALRKLDRVDPNELVTKMNRYVVDHARRYVFSDDERQKTFIQNRMSGAMVKPPFFPYFDGLAQEGGG